MAGRAKPRTRSTSGGLFSFWHTQQLCAQLSRLLQILFARQSITSIISLVYGYYTRVPHFPFGPRSVLSLLIARGLFGFFGVFGLYFTLRYMPLAEATVLTFLAPILTCYVCAWLIP